MNYFYQEENTIMDDEIKIEFLTLCKKNNVNEIKKYNIDNPSISNLDYKTIIDGAIENLFEGVYNKEVDKDKLESFAVLQYILENDNEKQDYLFGILTNLLYFIDDVKLNDGIYNILSKYLSILNIVKKMKETIPKYVKNEIFQECEDIFIECVGKVSKKINEFVFNKTGSIFDYPHSTF